MAKTLDNKKRTYIKILSFSDEANSAVNDAISISKDCKSKVVTTAQMFIAMLEGAKNKDKILKQLGTSMENLRTAHNEIMDNNTPLVEYFDDDAVLSEDEVEFTSDADVFMDITNENTWDKNASNSADSNSEDDSDSESVTDAEAFNVNSFSKGIVDLFNMVQYFAYEEDREINCDFIVDIMMRHAGNDAELHELFSVAGISMDRISHVENMDIAFFVPQSLADYVIDMNTDSHILNAKIRCNEEYTNEMIEILSRKVKANPVLIGEPGVGKTTAVYGLVQKIVAGDVPEQFKDKHIVYINSATITAGMVYNGAFQGFMKTLIKWAQDVDAILFFDEIHALISAGKTSGDSADTGGNIIKSALADGSLKIIGATTIKEYHKYIENDTGFTRRIQEIEVKEPSVKDAIDIIGDTICSYEAYHNVKVNRGVIELAVKLSNRYMKDKFLPDKAYTVLDQACARTKLANRVAVKEETVNEVVSKITGIDITKLSSSESKSLLKLEATIEKQVIGQSDAVHRVCKAIRRAKAGTRESDKPIASFLFVGPTGVGKTELCKVLSEEVTPGRENCIKIDMSEFNEKHSVARFIGSVPGYVGYGEGGQLTEKVKHNPYSVLLFDEIEKAHPEVFNIFLQLLDEGRLTDGSGQTVDFTNCIIIMTSNAGYGAENLNKRSVGFGISVNGVEIESEAEEKDKQVRKALEETFKPEFLNRLDDIVVFDKLGKDHCKMIVKLLLKKLSDRVKENRKVSLKFSNSVIDMLTEKGYSDKYGARNLKRKIQDIVEDGISVYLLDGTMKDGCEYTVSYNTKSGEISIK